MRDTRNIFVSVTVVTVLALIPGLLGCGKAGQTFVGANLGAPAPQTVLDPARLSSSQKRVWEFVLQTHCHYLQVEGPAVRQHYFTAVAARLNLMPPTGVTLTEAQVICLLGLPDYVEDSGVDASGNRWRDLYYRYTDGGYSGIASVSLANGLMSSTGANSVPDPIPATWLPYVQTAAGSDSEVSPLAALPEGPPTGAPPGGTVDSQALDQESPAGQPPESP